MLSMTALQRNHLYQFRGQQLRYSHRSNSRANAPFIFIDSKGRRKELSQNQVQREVLNLLSFVRTDDEAMSTTGYANAPAGKLGDRPSVHQVHQTHFGS